MQHQSISNSQDEKSRRVLTQKGQAQQVQAKTTAPVYEREDPMVNESNLELCASNILQHFYLNMGFN